MTKLQIAVLDALDSGEWMSSAEVAKLSSFNRESVRCSLSDLVREGVVIKKSDPNRTGCALYRSNSKNSRATISQFDQLIRGVRA